MSFNIYEVSSEADQSTIELLDDNDIVESGLSAGEFRQAMLDRFRQELKTEDVYFVNLSLEHFGLDFEADLAETAEGRNSMMDDIENFLYDTEDEIFNQTMWEFHNESLYVKYDED